jgi:hypothetical protein
MNASGKLYEVNEAGRIVRQQAGRKGGRRKVKKGFAKTLTSQKAREYVKKRWEKRETDTNPSFE